MAKLFSHADVAIDWFAMKKKEEATAYQWLTNWQVLTDKVHGSTTTTTTNDVPKMVELLRLFDALNLDRQRMVQALITEWKTFTDLAECSGGPAAFNPPSLPDIGHVLKSHKLLSEFRDQIAAEQVEAS